MEYENDSRTIWEKIGGLEANVEAILKNHLPHIQRSVDSMNAKFWAVVILLISNLVAVIAFYITK